MFFLLCLTQCTMYKFTFDFSEILNCICAEIIFVFANWLVLIFSKTLSMLFGRYDCTIDVYFFDILFPICETDECIRPQNTHWLKQWILAPHLWQATVAAALLFPTSRSHTHISSNICNGSEFQRVLTQVMLDVYRHGSIAKQYMIKVSNF